MQCSLSLMPNVKGNGIARGRCPIEWRHHAILRVLMGLEKAAFVPFRVS